MWASARVQGRSLVFSFVRASFRALPQNMYFLAIVLTLTGLVASYLLADISRRLPGLRAIL